MESVYRLPIRSVTVYTTKLLGSNHLDTISALTNYKSMTENRNHWADLATSLGAQPAPEEPKLEPHITPPHVVEAKDESVTESGRPATTPRPAPAMPRPAADWDALASNLGVAPLPAPPRPSPVKEPPAEKPAAWQPAAHRPAPEPPPRQPAVWGKAKDETAGDLAEVFAEPQVAGEKPADVDVREPSEAEGRRSGGRGRRRRRGRGRGQRESSPAEQENRPEQIDREDLELELPEDSAETFGGEAAGSDASAAERESGDTRSRRGRSRRGRSRGQDTRGGQRDSRPEKPEQQEESDQDSASTEMAAEPYDDYQCDEDDADATSARVGFRSIPTWEEAVGTIVAANLEARAKRPGNDAPPRSRGGRGSRGGKRGGGGNRGPRQRPGKRG